MPSRSLFITIHSRLCCILICMSATLTVPAGLPYSPEIDSLLTLLDEAIANSDHYSTIHAGNIRRIQKNDFLTSPTPSLQEQYAISQRLYRQYNSFQCDSSSKYIERSISLARQLGDSSKIYQTIIQEARLNTSLNKPLTSISLLSSINTDSLTVRGRSEYLDACLYAYDNTYPASPGAPSQLRLDKRIRDKSDGIAGSLPPDNPSAMRYRETVTRQNGLLDSAMTINDRRLDSSHFGTTEYASACLDRAMIYYMRGDSENRIKYLILSAIAGIRASVRDNVALATLAHVLTSHGYFDRSHAIFQMARADASALNSPLRKSQNESIAPLIDTSYSLQQTNKHNRTIIIALLIIATGLAVAAFILNRRQRLLHRQSCIDNSTLRGINSQLTDINSNLLVSNNTKEQYMSQFLELCSKYIGRLSSYRQLVYLKVNQKQYDELSRLTHSTDFTREETEEFYENFDKAFTMMYPNFIVEFNLLLREECRTTPAATDRLTPQMRIFALIRLGITNSNDIASLLHYSMSTIYNYRVKVHKQTIDPPKIFESKIRNIDAY